MPICVNIRGKNRQVCIADLDRQIQLQNRAIQPPAGGSVDYTLLFTAKDSALPPLDEFDSSYGSDFAGVLFHPTDTGLVWAMIESVNGESIFDLTNVERTVTHKVYIRYEPTVTAETWFTIDGQRFDILTVEDLDFRHEFQLLRCTDRGSKTRSTTAA